MNLHRTSRAIAAAAILAASGGGAVTTAQPPPLAMDTARLTISGTSNVHNYSVWTDTVHVTEVKLAADVAAQTFWEDVVQPGVLERFSVAIPVGTLASRDPGLDKNMYLALKADAHRDVTFKLARLEAGPTGALMAVGTLRIAGVGREVAFPLQTERRDATLVVKGRLPLLMTDYGISPPKAMLGMLRTHPKVTVAFEVVLSVPGT